MICLIRIKGDVCLKKEIRETLVRLRLRRKYACVVLTKPTKEQLGMIKKVKDFIAFGEINKETFGKLVEFRGQLKDKTKKTDLKKVTGELLLGKKYEELNLKPFFRLHPPRKGINSKKHFPKGDLGDNRKKESRMHGKNMGTHGGGARKKRKGSGHRGGKGMSGSGKRADHKKTLVQQKYGHNYFGKQGITSRGTKKDKRQRINLKEIILDLNKYGKKTAKGYEINLPKYKILGTGEVKEKLIITCLEVSKSTKAKIEKAGGSINIKEIKKIKTPLVVNPKHKKKNEK